MPSPLITQKIQEFFQVAHPAFMNMLASIPATYQQYATEIPSTTERNVYPWLAKTTGIREWVGDRVVQNIASRSYELANKHWEGTLGFDIDKISDDMIGLYKAPLEQLSQDAAEFKNFKLAEQLELGTTELCWDNQFFFDVDHPVNIDDASKGVQSNRLTGSTFDLTVDPVAAFKNVRAAQRKWMRDDGRRAGLLGKLIVVGPDLEEPARQIEKAFNVVKVIRNVAGTENVAAAGAENIFQGEVSVLVLDHLVATAGNPWYLFDVSKSVKPLIWQNRQDPMFDVLDQRTAGNVFSSRQVLAGVDFRGAPGYTFPGLAFRGAGS